MHNHTHPDSQPHAHDGGNQPHEHCFFHDDVPCPPGPRFFPNPGSDKQPNPLRQLLHYLELDGLVILLLLIATFAYLLIETLRYAFP